MQRNNNHIIIIGIVLILLMLTYNMAITPNISAAVDTEKSIVSWIQAFIAMLALFLSVYNMRQQKKATERQLNLSLYEKRYEIYTTVMKFIIDVKKVQSHESFQELKRKGLLKGQPDIKKHMEKIKTIIKTFEDYFNECNFLLPTSIKIYIESLCDFADQYKESMNLYENAYNQEVYTQYIENIKNQKKIFVEKSKEISSVFRFVLDFSEL